MVLAQGQKEPFSPLPPHVQIVIDTYSGKGPLMGIYSGLKHSQDAHSPVVACDMPFLNMNLLRYMMDIAGGFDVVIPKSDGLVEPLHAVYSMRCLAVMESMLVDGNFKVSDLLQRVKVRYVEESEIDLFDPQHLSFFNINTPADLKMAEQIVSREEVRSDLCRRSPGENPE